MKPNLLSFLFMLSLQASTAVSQLVLPNIFSKSLKKPSAQQKPVMPLDIPGVLTPVTSDSKKGYGSDELSISDVIGKERIINIFAGFTRDIDTISKRLDDNSKNTTVLAPLNLELQKLPRKPWEDPKDYDSLGTEAYKGGEGEGRAHRNLRRFVENHVVPVSPWKEGEKVETVGGEKVWWEDREGTKMVQPGNIEVSSIANKVSNGEVWVLKGCLNYQ